MAVTHRNAYTLVELVMSMTAASVLMGGLAASLFLTLEAFEGQPAAVTAAEAGSVQAELLRDLGRATSFSARTADTVTFTVPDEDGDGAEETLSYSYDSTAGTLSMTSRGFTTNLLTGVTGSTFSFLGRDRTGAAPTPSPYDVNQWGMRWASGVVFEGYAQAASADTTLLSVPVPAGVEDGDLLIAAIMADKGEVPTPPGGDGWTLVDSQTHGGTALALAVYWKIAAASDPSSYGFAIVDDEDMFGFIMRFTGHDLTTPIDADSGIAEGDSSAPPSPAVTSTVNDALVLRIGCFDDEDVTAGVPGLSGHTAITMGSSQASGTTCSGGAGYLHQVTAGSSGTSSFSLTASEQYLTITLALKPR